MEIAISRQRDAQHLNSILNHPEVYPYVAGRTEGPLDFTGLIDDPDVIVLMGEYGGQLYQRVQPGLFHAHSFFLPEGRGEWALACTRESLKSIFSRTEAVEILTLCPTLSAKALAKSIGGTYEFTLPAGWVMGGKPVPADVYSLTIQGWMKSDPTLPSRGKWFHERLESELSLLGIAELAHDDDETHDRYVGAACELMFGGQPNKACVFYNRVAVLANWHPIAVLDYRPLVVDIGSAILVMRGDDFFAIPHQKSAA